MFTDNYPTSNNHTVKNSPYSPNKTVTVNTNQSANSEK